MRPVGAMARSGTGGHVGGQDVVRVAPGILAGPVVSHRGARSSLAGRDLDVAQSPGILPRANQRLGTQLAVWRGAIDGYVGWRVGGEVRPGPVRMPGLQLEPGHLGHQVELGRPDVTVRSAGQLRLAALAEPEMVRHHVLAQNVVGVRADAARLVMGRPRCPPN